MPVYHGVVKDNVVVLPSGISLSDGAIVQVRVLSELPAPTVAENHFKQSLVVVGLLREIKTPLATRASSRTPIRTKGKPLSQSIIEERR